MGCGASVPRGEYYEALPGVARLKSNKPRNLPASVRDRLMKLAAQRREDFGLVLERFGMERLLYRLSQSGYRDRFILKGALLFEVWTAPSHRPTRDIDLLANRFATQGETRKILQEICLQPVEDDGLVFQAESVRVVPIREDQGYGGLRVRCRAQLMKIRIPVQVDIGYGDPVTPAPIKLTYPTLLDFPAPALRAYPPETVVAEKFHAMVRFGIVNSRMKDFFATWTRSRQFRFDGESLGNAIAATFKSLKADLPASVPPALSAEFAKDRAKKTQWRAFLAKNRLDTGRASLEDVIGDLRKFLMPVVQAVSANQKRGEP